MRSVRVLGVAAGVILAAAVSSGAVRDAAAGQAPTSGDAPASANTGITPNDTLVYVGSYTTAQRKSAGKGIYLFKLQTENLEVSQNITLVPLGLAAEAANASYFDIDPARRLLFAVNEIDEFEGKPTGAVSAYAIDPATGKLTLLNQRSSMGKHPCHIVLDKDRKHVIVANYGGSIAVLPIGPDGKLGEATAVIQHSGKSVDPQLQTQPHTHCAALDPANRFAFACDLGLDKVLAYTFDAQQGKLAPGQTPFASMKPGAGPRAMAFRPDGRFAYVASELSSTITAFAYDTAAGSLTELQTVSTVPDYFDGKNSAAELGMHPSGKYLYVSNRGHNSVVLFGIDQEKGTLTYVEEQGTGGKTPAHFGIEPTAKHLAIANLDSDTVLVCRIDGGNGRLKPSGVFASVPSPAFVKFLSPPQ